jgi:XapX domain-containing protein
MFTSAQLKICIGLLLGFGIGIGCRLGNIPSPAPPVLTGALLVFSMTIGWILTDRWFAGRPNLHENDCAGPNGRAHSVSKTKRTRL